MSKDYVLETNDNEKIRITTYGNHLNPCLIFVHGFKGFKDWGFGPYLAEYFSQNNFFVITFNFSLNGVGENKTEFTELDKFAENSLSREVEELNFVISSYYNGFFGEIDFERKVGLLGHSRGGAVVLLTGASNEKVSAVATWSAISKLDRYSERQKKDWEEVGFFEVLNSRTNQMMRMNYSFLEDIERNSENSLNLEKAVLNLNKPLLIAHGDQDLAVPVAEANLIYEWADKNLSELFIIHNTGHTFNIQHPFAGTNEKFEKLLNKTNIFLTKHLN